MSHADKVYKRWTAHRQSASDIFRNCSRASTIPRATCEPLWRTTLGQRRRSITRKEPHCDDLVGKHAEQLAFFASVRRDRASQQADRPWVGKKEGRSLAVERCTRSKSLPACTLQIATRSKRTDYGKSKRALINRIAAIETPLSDAQKRSVASVEFRAQFSPNSLDFFTVIRSIIIEFIISQLWPTYSKIAFFCTAIDTFQESSENLN